MIQKINSLNSGNILVCEIAVAENYMSWLVIRLYKNGLYSIREELFKIEDIIEELDPIGNHIFRNEVLFESASNIHDILKQKELSLADFTESWNTEYPL